MRNLITRIVFAINKNMEFGKEERQENTIVYKMFNTVMYNQMKMASKYGKEAVKDIVKCYK